MQAFKKKFKEWVYSLSTEDRYAEYNPDETPNFNMGHRSVLHNDVNNSQIKLTLHDEESNLALDDNINIENNNVNNEGVSEILLAWRHIDSWTDEHNPDLNATLGDPVTNNDILHAEEDLNLHFPQSVKVSMRVHDGQEDMESMTGTSGLIYGLQLMTLDQIVAMTQAWRNVAANLRKRESQRNSLDTNNININNNNNNSSNSNNNNANNSNNIPNNNENQFKLQNIPRQQSCPPNYVKLMYANPSWIPLVTDHAGNHIGVDLDPEEDGKWGQVIIFGRDFDTKYVIASNWGEFLLSFANDLEEGNWYLVEDSDDYLAGDGELVFRDKKARGPIQDYLEVLKKRTILKYKNVDTVPNENANRTQMNNTYGFATTVNDNTTTYSNNEINSNNNISNQHVQPVQDQPLPKDEVKQIMEQTQNISLDDDEIIAEKLKPTDNENDMENIITDDENDELENKEVEEEEEVVVEEPIVQKEVAKLEENVVEEPLTEQSTEDSAEEKVETQVEEPVLVEDKVETEAEEQATEPVTKEVEGEEAVDVEGANSDEGEEITEVQEVSKDQDSSISISNEDDTTVNRDQDEVVSSDKEAVEEFESVAL